MWLGIGKVLSLLLPLLSQLCPPLTQDSGRPAGQVDHNMVILAGIGALVVRNIRQWAIASPGHAEYEAVNKIPKMVQMGITIP